VDARLTQIIQPRRWSRWRRSGNARASSQRRRSGQPSDHLPAVYTRHAFPWAKLTPQKSLAQSPRVANQPQAGTIGLPRTPCSKRPDTEIFSTLAYTCLTGQAGA